MIITRATEYAIRAVLYLAKQPEGQIVLKKNICETQEITPAFLTKIFQPLIKAGIVASRRGVGGGFFLSRAPSDISVYDIYVAQEGELHLNQCLIHKGHCDRDTTCPMHTAWAKARNQMVETLRGYDLSTLVKMEKQNIAQLTS